MRDMDMEELSKSQIVLLTLLVSFVTSMATGIVSVSLMGQTPPAVAQTVNRVIERTVETVVPSDAQPAAAATVITQEKTVVVKESDLVAQAVAKASPSIVRAYTSGSSEAIFLGLGVVVNGTGLIVLDAALLDERAEAVIVLSDGTRLRAFVVNRNKIAGTAFLEPATTTIDGKPVPAWSAAQLSVGTPTLGESTVVIAGRSTTRIAGALVTALAPKSDDVPLALIETDVSASDILPGSPLVNTNGAVIGFSTGVSRAEGATSFVPAVGLMPPMKGDMTAK